MAGGAAERVFIIEADGGSRGNPGPAGYGAVVKDAATDGTLTEVAEFIGKATNNVAEYRGLVAGLRAAYELDPTARVRVRMDSKLVVEQMSGRWKIKHPDMRPLAMQAQRIYPPDAVSYEWIPRERNKHADRLANEAMDAGRRGEQWSPGASTAELAAEPASPDTATAPDPGGTLAGGGNQASDSASTAGWGPDLGPPTTCWLLRHGETVLTPEKRFSGSGGSDPELSAVGRRQAAAVAADLAERGGVTAIVSSPLLRCQETAGTLAETLGLSLRTDEGLRETNFGAWEGLTFAEVRERYPEDLTAWLSSADAEPTGGGESFTAVARRVARSRDKLLSRYPGRTVLVVTHVTPIKTLVRLALDAPPESLFRMELSAASLSSVAYYADGNASLRLLNDTRSLPR